MILQYLDADVTAASQRRVAVTAESLVTAARGLANSSHAQKADLAQIQWVIEDKLSRLWRAS